MVNHPSSRNGRPLMTKLVATLAKDLPTLVHDQSTRVSLTSSRHVRGQFFDHPKFMECSCPAASGSVEQRIHVWCLTMNSRHYEAGCLQIYLQTRWTTYAFRIVSRWRNQVDCGHTFQAEYHELARVLRSNMQAVIWTGGRQFGIDNLPQLPGPAQHAGMA